MNEGFATWVGNLAVNHFYPEWDVWTNFVSEEVASAFQMDALNNSHPIEVEITDTGSINQVFVKPKKNSNLFQINFFL